MSKISDTFESQALSIKDTLLLHNSNVGYRIPIYQRGYRWGEKDIFRLFESILHGIILLEENSSIRFIGTIILSNDKEKKEQSFGGISLSVVDGQQRLTTVALIICRLMNEIMLKMKEIDSVDDTRVLLELLDSLRSCIVGRKNSTIIRDYLSEFYPRLVRESSDYRGHTASTKNYESFIAEYLFDFGNHYYNFISNGNPYNNFEFVSTHSNQNSEDNIFFKVSIKHIDNLISRIAAGKYLTDDSDDEVFPLLNKISNNDNYLKVLEESDIKFGSELSTKFSEELSRIVFLSCYLLNNVSLTCVQVEDDRYVFDIFDALNTTGEPLTAIETFKPEVIKFTEDQKDLSGGFEVSNSKRYFDEIDRFISTYKDPSKRQKETKEVITAFALYLNGDTQNHDLGGQRRYLRNKYGLIPCDGNVYSKKESFVEALRDLALFRHVFWREDGLNNALLEIEDFEKRQSTLMCMDFIRDMNTSLAIPILARYYFYAKKTNEWSKFMSAVKSITAFIAIRRGATGGTAGVDSDLRSLMRKGHKKNDKDTLAIKIGLDFNGSLPDINTLNKYLLSYIDRHQLGTDINKNLTEQSWISKVSKQPLYDKSKALCKFLLMVAAHNTVEGKAGREYILAKDGRNHLNFLEISKWRNSLYKTVEHIAPQNGRGVWDDDIYNDPDTVHTLGNLILLPKLENTIIGNKKWSQKRMFFKAFAQEDKKEIPNIIDEAKNSGYPFSKSAIAAIDSGRYMPLIYSITSVEYWSLDLIQERSENICQLAWYELSKWIGIEKVSEI